MHIAMTYYTRTGDVVSLNEKNMEHNLKSWNYPAVVNDTTILIKDNVLGILNFVLGTWNIFIFSSSILIWWLSACMHESTGHKDK